MKTIEKQLEAQSVAHFPYTHGQSFEDNRRTMQQDVKRAWDEQMKQSGRIQPVVPRSESMTPDLVSPQRSARGADVDPAMKLGKSHRAVDFVRQLDRTAMKNCMELALLRHEKELSVRQITRDQEEEMFRHSIERGRVQNQAELQNKINIQKSNKKNLIQQKMAKD